MELIYRTDKTVKELKNSIEKYIINPNKNWNLLVKITKNNYGTYQLSHTFGRRNLYFIINLDRPGYLIINWQATIYDLIDLIVTVFICFIFIYAFIISGSYNIVHMLKIIIPFLIIDLGCQFLWFKFYILKRINKFINQIIIKKIN